jgi:predicted DNA-binding protein
MAKSKAKVKSVILPIETHEQLKALAAKEDRPISSYLRTKIAELHKKAGL